MVGMTKGDVMCRIIKKLSLFAFCLLLWLAAGTSSRAETMYQMSASQLNELNSTIDNQENRLMTLQVRLDVLMKNSTEQNQALNEARTQLNEALTQVTETRQNLKNANESLANVKQTLAKQEESLNQLEVLVKKLEHENGVLRKQRNGWTIATAIATAVCLV